LFSSTVERLPEGSQLLSSLIYVTLAGRPVDELLKVKPRLNLRTHGETPIFYAARLKRLKTLDLLIKAGADPSITDNHGRNAVDIARARHLPKDFLDRLTHLKPRG
jgi:ankyrin repeat protein